MKTSDVVAGALTSLLLAAPTMAQVDLSGSWASPFHEDQQESTNGPDLGDFVGLPINDDARGRALSFTTSLLSQPERQCLHYPSFYLFGSSFQIFRGNSAADLGQGRDNLLRQICRYIGGRLDLTGLFVIGGDFDAGVITRWDAYDAAGTRNRMGSFFRVRNGLVVEWMDSAVDGTSPATRANPNSPACQAVTTALGARTGGAPLQN
jgi:hypothetical protein